jgi:hypothetical protein
MNSSKIFFLVFAVLEAGYASGAAVRISDDRGGRVGEYLDRYDAVQRAGDTVSIEGACLSACTMILGAVPQDKICVTNHATLGFHAAYNPGKGHAINVEATKLLYSHYPIPVRNWIDARGGLKSHMIFLRGKELMNMYRACRLNVRAAVLR